MTRFILHIGPHKTGSTYLQNHLTDNRAALAGRGIYYPREWTTPEIGWCHAELAALLQQGEFDAVARNFTALKAAGWPTILLSSEDISSVGEDRLRFLAECIGGDAEIVFFARRWSETLPSRGQEHIRQGGCESLAEFVAKILVDPFGSETINFSLVLDRFANAFGLPSLRVLSYNNILKRGGDLFGYFAAKILGVDTLPIASLAPAHTSLSIENIEVVRVLNVLCARHPGEISWQIGNVVAAVQEHPLPQTRRAMAGSVAELPFDESAEPFRSIYDRTVAKFDSMIDKEGAGPEELLFERQRTSLRYIAASYLLDPAVLPELSNLLAELAGTSPAPQAAAPQPKAAPSGAVAIEFSGAGNSGSYCATGWSAPEEGWQWAVGPEARILMPRPDQAGDYLLTVKLRPFLAMPHLPRQRITIAVNGMPLTQFDMAGPSSVRSCIIPSVVIAKARDLTIIFQTPDAARPADHGQHDTRQLSFAFHALTLTPLSDGRSLSSDDRAEAGAARAFAPADT